MGCNEENTLAKIQENNATLHAWTPRQDSFPTHDRFQSPQDEVGPLKRPNISKGKFVRRRPQEVSVPEPVSSQLEPPSMMTVLMNAMNVGITCRGR